jgi:hypothetical protein
MNRVSLQLLTALCHSMRVTIYPSVLSHSEHSRKQRQNALCTDIALLSLRRLHFEVILPFDINIYILNIHFIVCLCIYFMFMSSSSYQLALFGYPDWGFSVLFPQLLGKYQGKTRKDGARPRTLPKFLCCSMYCLFCVVLFIFFL